MKKVFIFLCFYTFVSLILTSTTVNAQDLLRAASTSGDGKPDSNSHAKGLIDEQSFASEYAGLVASEAWSVSRDQVVDIIADEAEAAFAAITTNAYGRLIRDEWGQIYKITPKGKRLPLGLSTETIQDIAAERGFKLDRVKLTTKQAKQLGDRIKGGWTILKFGHELLKINNDETLTPEEQQNRIIIETIAAEVNIVVGRGISTLATAGNIGTAGTLGAGLVAGVALERVKTAFITRQEMLKAIAEAAKAEKSANQELLRMANTRMDEINKAIEEGDLDKADEMVLGMSRWASRRAFGRNTVPEMYDIYRMCDGMLNDIYTTRKQIQQEAIDAYNRRLAEYAKEQKEARKREEELDKLFSVEATATKYTLAPEETTTITIAALTGTPPFTLSGVLSGTFDADNPFVLELPIGIETGHYYLPITATDAAGHVRETRLEFKVVEDIQKEEIVTGNLIWMTRNLDVDVGNNCWPRARYCAEFNPNGTCLSYYWKEHNEYGRLYDWESAIAACESVGWRLPTDFEWQQLVDYWGGSDVAGGKLKSTLKGEMIQMGEYTHNNPNGHPFWYAPNTDATNESGFSALAGGTRDTNGWGHERIGVRGKWWSATEYHTENASSWLMFKYDSRVSRVVDDREMRLSVRCVRDN